MGTWLYKPSNEEINKMINLVNSAANNGYTNGAKVTPLSDRLIEALQSSTEATKTLQYIVNQFKGVDG